MMSVPRESNELVHAYGSDHTCRPDVDDFPYGQSVFLMTSGATLPAREMSCLSGEWGSFSLLKGVKSEKWTCMPKLTMTMSLSGLLKR